MKKITLDDPRRPWLPAALLMLLSLLVFSPVIFGGHFFWDDYDLLVNNAPIRAADGLQRIWFSTENPDYFPLTSTMFWIEWRLFGDATPLTPYALNPYHLVNALLHGGTAILLWRTLRAMHLRGALLAALLFVVHPVNAESVSWIAEGKNTLSVCLMMASLLLWVRSESSGDYGRYVASVGLFLLALLAKTAVVMLPVALLLILWYRRRATRPALLRTVPYFVFSLGLGALTWWFQMARSIRDVPIREDSLLARIAVAGWALWFYLFHAIVPAGISFAYGRWELAQPGVLAFVPLFLFVALLALLWFLRDKIGRGPVAGLAAYAAMLLPILGLVNVFFMRYSFVSDHWQYPAIPIVCAAAGYLVVRLARRGTAALWNGVMAGAALLLALLALDSASIAAVYRTPNGVWEDVLVHNPDSWLAHVRLGEMALQRARATDPRNALEALVHFRRVVELQPTLAIGYADLGNAYVAVAQPDEALKCYDQGLRSKGSKAEMMGLHLSRGALLGNRGDEAAAGREFQAALEILPQSATALTVWGKYNARRGDLAAARDAWEKAAESNPMAIEPRLLLVDVLMRTGDPQKAARYANEALAIDPHNAIAARWVQMLGNAPPPATVPGAPR